MMELGLRFERPCWWRTWSWGRGTVTPSFTLVPVGGDRQPGSFFQGKGGFSRKGQDGIISDNRHNL